MVSPKLTNCTFTFSIGQLSYIVTLFSQERRYIVTNTGDDSVVKGDIPRLTLFTADYAKTLVFKSLNQHL